MKKWIVGFVVVLQCFVFKLNAQESYTERANSYVLQYGPLAIKEQVKNGVPAAITLAQGILETEAGASELATQANNHFGIKCKSDWTGQSFTHTDDRPNECFRKYNTAEESYIDHSIYLSTTPRYAALFQLPVTDYKSWAKGLKRCGYATSPTYSQRLIKIVEDFHLQDYTYAAINKKTDVNNATAGVNPPATKQNVETPQTSNDIPEVNEQSLTNGQEIKMNGLKAIYLFKGEALLKYAIQYHMRYEHLLAINDLEDAPLASNMFVYLEKKKYRGIRPTHIVKAGENMQLISQLEGIQLRRLMMLNHILKTEDEPVEGTVLELQKMADSKPMLVSDNKAIKTQVKKEPIVQNTATKSDEYVYKTPKPNPPIRGGKKTMTAYVQKGDKIEKVEVGDQPQPTTIPVTSTTVTPTPVPNTKPQGLMKEQVTEIIVDKNNTTTTDNSNNDTKPVVTEPVNTDKEQKVTETKTTTVVPTTTTTVTDTKPTIQVNEQKTTEQKANKEENEDEKDPLVLLKRKLDKVVYADNKTEPTENTVATTTPVPPTTEPVTNVAPPSTEPVANVATATSDEDNATIKLGKNEAKLYTVKKGETAFFIARKNNITVKQLMEWNDLENGGVKVGQKLRVKK